MSEERVAVMLEPQAAEKILNKGEDTKPLEPIYKVELASKGKLGYPEVLSFRPLKVRELKILSSSPSDRTYLDNLIKVLQRVCMEDGFDIRNLTYQDFLTVLIGVRANSLDTEYEVVLKCPSCGKSINKKIDLTEIHYEPIRDDFEEPAIIDGYSIYLPRVRHSVKSILEEDVYSIIQNILKLSDAEFENIPAKTFRAFIEWIAENDYGPDLNQTVTCSCGEELSFVLPFRKEFFI